MNTNKFQKDKYTGKFQNKSQGDNITESQDDDADTLFIQKVKDDLYQGYLYIDEIERAYKLLTMGNELATLRVMKIKIINSLV